MKFKLLENLMSKNLGGKIVKHWLIIVETWVLVGIILFIIGTMLGSLVSP